MSFDTANKRVSGRAEFFQRFYYRQLIDCSNFKIPEYTRSFKKFQLLPI